MNELKAGEALDRLVAEKVMGAILPQAWADPSVGASHGDPGGYRIGVMPYSTDIKTAWEIVERLSTTTKEFWTLEYFSTGATAAFSYDGGRDKAREVGEHKASAETMPLAICLAALKAVGYQEA